MSWWKKRSVAVAGVLLACGPLLTLGGTGAAAATESPAAPSKPKHMFVVAHRGDAKNAPESTIDAFGKAIDKGVEGVEFDVRYTKDGVPVALHDDTLNRTTNCKGLIAELTYTVVQQCSTKDALGQIFRDTRVPTVRASLAYIYRNSPRVMAFIHLKTKITAEQAVALRRIAAKNGMGRRVVFVVEKKAQRGFLTKAGAPKSQLGLMVHKPGDYSRSYQWLVPFRPDVTAELVGPPIKAGKTVLPVESVPAELETIVAAGSNGVYLNNLDEGLAYLKERGLH